MTTTRKSPEDSSPKSSVGDQKGPSDLLSFSGHSLSVSPVELLLFALLPACPSRLNSGWSAARYGAGSRVGTEERYRRAEEADGSPLHEGNRFKPDGRASRGRTKEVSRLAILSGDRCEAKVLPNEPEARLDKRAQAWPIRCHRTRKRWAPTGGDCARGPCCGGSCAVLRVPS